MLKKGILFFSLFTTLVCFGQNNTALFNEATAAYNAKEYKKAINLYTAILNNKEHSAAVYYNLANAHYKLNQIAPSIYFYEKALLLAPHDKAIKTNLSYAQNMTVDAIDTLPQTSINKFYTSITSKLSFDQWAYLAVASMFLFVLLYITFYLINYSSRKRWAFIGSLVALSLCIVAITFAYIQKNDFDSKKPAILFAEESSIKAEPNLASNELFTLHEGTKVNVLDQLNDWYHIQLADGKTGWVPQTDIKLLLPF